LDRILDDLAHDVDGPTRREGTSPRLRCGVDALDRLLGGVPTGRPALIATDREVHVDAIVASVVLRSPYRVLLAMDRRSHAARLLLAGEARVPYALLATGELHEAEWSRVKEACGALAERQERWSSDHAIFVTAASTAHGVVRAARSVDASLCVVAHPERFAASLASARAQLAREIASTPIAMLLVTHHPCDDPDANAVSDDPVGRTITLLALDSASVLRTQLASIDVLCRLLDW